MSESTSANSKAADAMENVQARIRLRLETALKEFELSISGVDASAVFPCYALHRIFRKNQGLRPDPVAIEYAAWLLWPRLGTEGSRDLQKVERAIQAIEVCNNAFAMAETFVGDGTSGNPAINVHVRLHSGLVRGSAYPIQLVRRIEGLFAPFETEISAILGVGPISAVGIAKAILRLTEDNIHRMQESFRNWHRRGEEIAKNKDASAADAAELAEIAKKLQNIVQNANGEWLPTFDQVKEVNPAITRSEWDHFRTHFGFTRESRATMLEPVEVQDRPFYFISDEQATSFHLGECFDAIFRFFDDFARSSVTLVDRYGLHVSDWMESQIGTYLRQKFPLARVIESACFADPDNEGGETEADAVVVWGPFLIVLEAKGKRLPREAMRGEHKKLRQALKKNVEDAFVQAQRVVRVLAKEGSIEFKEKRSDKTVEVRRDRVMRVFPISVTLHHFAGVATQLGAADSLGLFKAKAYPWAVSLADLEVILRFIPSPDSFLHYIERRTQHQSTQVSLSGDELDIFGHYLGNRLQPGIYEQRGEITSHVGQTCIAFDGGSEQFDESFAAEWEGRQAPPFTFDLGIPPEVAEVIRSLAADEKEDAHWITFSLLSLDDPSLWRLADAIQKLRLLESGDGLIRRITFRQDSVVFNVMGHACLDLACFAQAVLDRARLEQYRQRPRATATLGFDLRHASPQLVTSSWVEGEIAMDDDIERLLREDEKIPRNVRLFGKSRKVGRNKPCPCGSGKKFKTCCLSKLERSKGHPLLTGTVEALITSINEASTSSPSSGAK